MPNSSPAPSDDTHYFALPLGTELFEFRVERMLGHGGFGITYLAVDTHLDERVALKEYMPNEIAVRISDATVKAKSKGDTEILEGGLSSFLEEARLLAKFRHRNIVNVRRFFKLHGTGYIVLEYEDGQTLSQQLAERPMDNDGLRRLLSSVLDGLDAVHQQATLHRDLKPSNIIMRPDGSPVLIDFGAARNFQSRNSRSVTAIATAGYSPPEQYIGGQQGPWTDLYALGAIAYRIVSGSPPPESLRRLRKDPYEPATALPNAGQFDPALLRTIDWMLKVDETERPLSVGDVRKSLAAPEFDSAAPSPAVNGRNLNTKNGSEAGDQTAKADAAKNAEAWKWGSGLAAAVIIGAAGLTYYANTATVPTYYPAPSRSSVTTTTRAAVPSTAEKAAAEKAAADKAVADRTAAEKAAVEKARAEKAAAEKVAAEKIAAERTTYDSKLSDAGSDAAKISSLLGQCEKDPGCSGDAYTRIRNAQLRFAALPREEQSAAYRPTAAEKASGYPVKPITLVVPYAAGGFADLIARTLAIKLSEELGQTVTVKNIVGAGGAIGSMDVARAPADGYRLLLGSTHTHVLYNILNKSASYDPLKDFVPIATIGSTPVAIYAPPQSPDLRGLIAEAKANPRKIIYASIGPGSFSHLVAEMFRIKSGNIDVTHEPYRGGTSQTLQNVAAGRVSMYIDVLTSQTLEMYRAGKIKILGVASPTRIDLAPSVPTVAEAAGITNFEISSWYIIEAPSGTPATIVRKLNMAILSILRNATFQSNLRSFGLLPARPSSSESTQNLIARDRDEFKYVVELSKIKID